MKPQPKPFGPCNPLAAGMGLVRMRFQLFAHLCKGDVLYAFKNFPDDYLWDEYRDGNPCVFVENRYRSVKFKTQIFSKTKTIIFSLEKIDRLYTSNEHIKVLELRLKIHAANNGPELWYDDGLPF